MEQVLTEMCGKFDFLLGWGWDLGHHFRSRTAISIMFTVIRLKERLIGITIISKLKIFGRMTNLQSCFYTFSEKTCDNGDIVPLTHAIRGISVPSSIVFALNVFVFVHIVTIV